jgi:hypothetical protein
MVAMFNAADIVSGVGILLFLVGSGYWLWFASLRGKIAKLRSGSPWNLLGTLTVIGLLVFAAGRMLAGRR